MEHYVGLDVSLKLTAICIVDRTEKIEREGVVSSDPEGLRNSSDRMPANVGSDKVTTRECFEDYLAN